MPEKSDNEALILIGAGIVLGIALIFIVTRKDQMARAQTTLQVLPTLQAQPPQQQFPYKQDTEFIKWYTETIIKPSIESAARESAQNAIRQFMENQRAEAEVQTLGSKTAMPRAKTGNWMITRDSEGAIVSIETMKNTPQKEQSTKSPIRLLLPDDKINTWKEHIP